VDLARNLIGRINVGDSLTRTAASRPDRLAVVDADPAVSEAVVVGLPHARWSEAVTAVVVPKPGGTIDASGPIATLKGRLDGFKVPKAVIVVDQLPKTSTGKIQKNIVRSEHSEYYEEG
jgi:acyl-CoA synthetase (AMP-forming)/AMP-acid ligase II